MKTEKEFKVTETQFVESVESLIQYDAILAEVFNKVFTRGEKCQSKK